MWLHINLVVIRGLFEFLKKDTDHISIPVKLIKVSPRDKVLSEGLGIAYTLNTGVHEACVT